MSRVLFIQNGEQDPPGRFATALRERGIAIYIVHAWRGAPVPKVPGRWSGVAIGGGSMSAYEAEQFLF